MKTPRTVALIAAAGHSTRMKFPKALLPLNGETAASSLAKTLFKHRLKTYLTLPDFLLRDQHFLATLRLYQPHICRNNYDHLGFSGSIKTVLEKAPGASGILITPVDTLHLSSALVQCLLNLVTHTLAKATILVPYAQMKPGHPVYFSRHFFQDLKNCHREGPAGLITQNKECVTRVFWPDTRILLNLNHPKDFLNYGL